MAVGRYDDLLMVLAPYLHGPRYSSYGRHFTKQHLLHRVAARLALFLRPGDQVGAAARGARASRGWRLL